MTFEGGGRELEDFGKSSSSGVLKQRKRFMLDKLFIMQCFSTLNSFLTMVYISNCLILCRKPMESNVEKCSAITLKEIEEGDEPNEFWRALGGKKYYHSLQSGSVETHIKNLGW